MTVIIIRNNEVVKSFRKYFSCFVQRKIYDWTENNFPKAKKKAIDMGANQIRIYY